MEAQTFLLDVALLLASCGFRHYEANQIQVCKKVENQEIKFGRGFESGLAGEGRMEGIFLQIEGEYMLIQYNQSMFKLGKANFRNNLQEQAQTPLNKPFSGKLQKTHLFAQNLIALNAPKTHQNTGFVAVPFHALLDALQIYCWRGRTQYPVVKAYCSGTILTKSQPNKRLNIQHIINNQSNFHPHQKLYLQVVTEQVQPLLNFAPLFLGPFAYAFKEALVGFQRLHALFGPFLITPQMIVVNSLGRVKVWISTHHNQNTKMQAQLTSRDYEQSSERIVVQQIKAIFYSLAHNNSTFRQFFAYIEGAHSFILLLKKLQEFTANKRIPVPHFLKRRSQAWSRRPFSPSNPILPFKPNPIPQLAASSSMKLVFKQRGSPLSTPLSKDQSMKSLRSRRKLQIIVNQLQSKQTLSTTSELNSQNVVAQFKANYERDCLACEMPKNNQQLKLKKLDSLQKNLENLFQNDMDTKEEEEGLAFELGTFGKSIKASTYFQGSSFCQKS